MNIRKLFGLAAIGGLLYAHKRHGGTFDVDSFKRSGRDLLDAAKQRTQDLRTKASSRMHEVADKMNEERQSQETVVEDVTASSTTGYGYGAGYPQR